MSFRPEPKIPWRSTVWPISRRIVSLPSPRGPRVGELTSELKRLSGFYTTLSQACAERAPAISQLEAAGVILRSGFARRAIGRIACLASEVFGPHALAVLAGLHRSLHRHGPPQPYTLAGYAWAIQSAKQPLDEGESARFFGDPRLDHHDLLGLAMRLPVHKDLLLGFEPEAAGGREEPRRRWESAARALDDSSLKFSRADSARDAQLAKVSALAKEWLPDAAPDFDAAVWVAKVRDRFTPPSVYLESPVFFGMSFWFYYLHSELSILFRDGEPPDLVEWVESLIASPKARWAPGHLETFRDRFVKGFQSFGGYSLSLFRGRLASQVRPRPGESGWFRPLAALARLCQEALLDPSVARSAAAYISATVPVTGYTIHGLVSALGFGIYLPQDLDLATDAEKEAWAVQQANSGWGGFSDDSDDFSDEDFPDPPDISDFAEESWWYCPQPVHPDANLVKVPVTDADEFQNVYASLGAPVGIV